MPYTWKCYWIYFTWMNEKWGMKSKCVMNIRYYFKRVKLMCKLCLCNQDKVVESKAKRALFQINGPTDWRLVARRAVFWNEKTAPFVLNSGEGEKSVCLNSTSCWHGIILLWKLNAKKYLIWWVSLYGFLREEWGITIISCFYL